MPFDEPYPDQLVVSLDLYERALQQRINDSYWNDNTDEVELLQKRMECVNLLRELGEEYYTRF